MNPTAIEKIYPLDVGEALDLIERAVGIRRESSSPIGRSRRIVSECLQLAGVSEAAADRVARRRVRDLYASRDMPIRLTLGAAVALDAAQRCEWLGFGDDLVLEHARTVAWRIPGLVSDRVLATTPSRIDE